MQLHLDRIVVDFPAGRGLWVRALDAVSLSILQGERIALMGAGGSGKSTLALALRGLVKPSRGTVARAFDHPDDRTGTSVPVALVLQRPEAALFGETVAQDVAFGAQVAGMDADQVDAAVTRALHAVGMNESWRERDPLAMSGGEQRRVAIAGALAASPRVLVLDEPTAGLDPESRALVLQAIARLGERGLTTITITHSPEDAALVSSRLVCMAAGRVHWDGPTIDALSHPQLVASLGIGTTTAVRAASTVARRLGVEPPATLDEDELADFVARQLGVRNA